jgi:beta-glucosidase
MRLRPFIGSLPLILTSTICLAQAAAGSEPFRNPGLSLDQRVEDLVSHLTLDEKIAMLGHMQPAIPRLGIKPFNY